MRVDVDYDLCEANAMCTIAAPDVFVVDDDENLQLLQQHPGEDLRHAVENAVRSCPKQALSVAEED